MTTLYTTKKTCSVCNTESEQTGIGSTNTFGSPDLDTRPPQMKRSTISHWIEKCPYCGYCNPSIEKIIENISDLIYSDNYKGILEDDEYPELARSFICQSYIYESLSDHINSAWSQIHAAWVCDDAKERLGAKQCRIKAVEQIKSEWNKGNYLIEEMGADFLLVADLLRRSNEYEEARAIILRGLNCATDDFIMSLLNAQKKLVENRNNLCYTMEEAAKLMESN